MQYNTLTQVMQPAISWANHKEDGQHMATVLRWLHLERRAALMEICGEQLTFAVSPEGDRHLAGAVFCHDRLCPLCAAFRSRKIFGQVSRVMDALPEGRRFVFLTLTTRNVPGDALKEHLNRITEGLHKLMRRSELKAVKGWFRALEITYNNGADTYHPHHHVILSVPPWYFKSGYISQARWRDMWRDVCGLDYDPVVDVRTVKPDKAGKLTGAAAEVAKYTVKVADILGDDLRAAMKPVEVLVGVLGGRRLVGFGGEMRALHKQLHLDDPIDGELTDRATLRPDVTYMLERYQWAYGLTGDWYRAPSQTGDNAYRKGGITNAKEKETSNV